MQYSFFSFHSSLSPPHFLSPSDQLILRLPSEKNRQISQGYQLNTAQEDAFISSLGEATQ